ncbi:MAG: NUDIX hydrolase [Acidimicrobiia bacterium]
MITEGHQEPPPNESIWAAGCVVGRHRKDGTPEFLLVHRPRYDDWSLPKGKIDKGEGFLDGALREVREETGVRGENPRLVGTVAYDTKNGNPKVVRWWLVDAGRGSFVPNSEVDRIKWVSFKKGLKKLTYRNDREVLDRANDMFLSRSAGVVYLVRHAQAGTRNDSDPNDWARKLDRTGKKQKRAIRQLLQAHPITRIGSSDFPRCRSTVMPLAKRLGIPVEFESALVEGSHPHRLVTLVTELQEEAAVLCTHGDVIHDLVGHLFAAGVPMAGELAAAKGSVWELRTIGGRVVSGQYIPPQA